MRICSTILGVALSSMAWSASALSLGSPRGGVVLGAPFDVVVGVQPDAGSDLASSCISAQLHAGDRAIESSRVRVTLLPAGNAVRVQSAYMVDEPVVTLKLLAGCQGAISRSYTLLPQLPESAQAATATGAVNQPINVAQLSPGAAPQAPAQGGPAAALAGGAAAASAPAATAGRAAAQRTPAGESRPAAAAARKPQAAARPARPNKARDAAMASVSLQGLPQLRMGPQLRMEPLEDWLGEQAKAPGAAVPDASAEQLAQASQRVQALEAEVDALKKRGGADSGQIAQLRSELEALRQASGNASWLFNALLLALIAAVAVIAWLAWRLRSGEQALFSRGQQAWRDSVERSSARPQDPARPVPGAQEDIDTVISPAGTHSGEAQPQARVDGRRGPDTLASPYLQRGIQMQPGVSYELREDMDPGDLGPATIPVGLQAAHPEVRAPGAGAAVPAAGEQRADVDKARRMVQPEQLFDVQQQAEFFISVGEHQQAIALLRSHIDTHEDSSPWAYLELLHLYYTLSRRDDYEQLRERFTQHFNGRVPSMAGFTDKGRDLLQGYAEELARIEALWPGEEVQACLAHYLFKEGGVAAQDAPPAFDLAAFEDLLLLFGVAGSTGAGMRGSLSGRVRTTPPPAAPAAAALDAGPDEVAAPGPGESRAFASPLSVAAGAQGAQFCAPDSLQPGSVQDAVLPQDSRSAPLDFDLQQLDLDIAQAELPDPGLMRSQPLQEGPAYRGDAAEPLLDIDLTEPVAAFELPAVDVPSRFTPAPPVPGGALGFGERNLKMPLDMDIRLELEGWQLEPPDTRPGAQGLDEPLSRSVDMLLSRETDPVFRKTPGAEQAGQPQELPLPPGLEDEAPKAPKPPKP